jgi:hypothetical protein
MNVIDLRGLPSRRSKIHGSSFYIPGNYIWAHTEYLLAREPRNKYDANAIAVYAGGRKVGHVAKSLARIIAPEMDRLECEQALVDAGPDRRDMLLPTTDAIRKLTIDPPGEL